MAEYDIVVVGSGIAGLSSAHQLADQGRVLVVDRGAVGQGTSSRASGVITTPVDYPDLPKWASRAIDSFRELDGRGVFTFDEQPFIRLVHSPAYAAMVRGRDDAVMLGPEESMARFGDVVSSPGAEGVAVYDNVGTCDVSAFLATLKFECERRGVDFRPDTTVTGVRVEDGRVVGVDTEYGPIDADDVVVAAGSATPDVVAEHVELPIRPFTWNAVYLDVDGDVTNWPMGGDTEHQLYWRTMPTGDLLVGRENQTFDADPKIDADFERLVDEDLSTFFAFDDFDVVRWETCPIPDATTPDARAIIDAPAAAPEGLVVAAGFHGAGVMAGLAIGDIVRSYVTGEAVDLEVEAFALDRFSDLGRDFPFCSLWD
ncbi:NAD(P)/FAD-dependent oxidoreductase [Haloferax sp. DFSO52]|uniref:NAD(P)/FAD-dependent oxidoreductase n=1 Tax=Haloferax sp. DFSO52 TaxID=3388505 RepID=UPI003A8504A5